MVYSHWLGSEPGPGQGLGLGPGRMGCMVLIRTFHTAPVTALDSCSYWEQGLRTLAGGTEG